MDIFLTGLIIIASILLILFVLIQNPKGGGVGASFSGNANQVFGVQKTTDILEKGTWGLIIVVVVLSIALNVFHQADTGVVVEGSAVEERAKEEVLPGAPALPTGGDETGGFDAAPAE